MITKSTKSTKSTSVHVVKETCKGHHGTPQTVYIVYAPVMREMMQVGVYDTRKEANAHIRAMAKKGFLLIN